ncbi:hypothetical protein F4212_06895 [Candidatus Poribacteria bacterium]|nr:hypothetical protein [Candidatus Poribacteria bacterium]
MNIRFNTDQETGFPHIYKHGVNEDEEILLNLDEDRTGSENFRVAIGQTRSGRYLRVIYLRDPQPHSVFVITAYDLKGKPLTSYRCR